MFRLLVSHIGWDSLYVSILVAIWSGAFYAMSCVLFAIVFQFWWAYFGVLLSRVYIPMLILFFFFFLWWLSDYGHRVCSSIDVISDVVLSAGFIRSLLRWYSYYYSFALIVRLLLCVCRMSRHAYDYAVPSGLICLFGCFFASLYPVSGILTLSDPSCCSIVPYRLFFRSHAYLFFAYCFFL